MITTVTDHDAFLGWMETNPGSFFIVENPERYLHRVPCWGFKNWIRERHGDLGSIAKKCSPVLDELTATGRFTPCSRCRPLDSPLPLSTGRHLVVYHNYDQSGLPAIDWEQPYGDVFTRLPFIKQEVGSRAFLIFGIGTPRRYFLWSSIVIEDVEPGEEDYLIASGPGWILNPPQELSGAEFDAFQHSCTNFRRPRAIDDLPYVGTLVELADKFHTVDVGDQFLAFANALVELKPDDRDAYRIRATALLKMGRPDVAARDFELALENAILDDDEEAADQFREAAKEAWLAVPDPEPTTETEAEVRVMRSIRQRQGQPEFRAKLLALYGGRCAVTGCDAGAALEAAHIRPYSGPATNTPRNGLLLRADIHTLFDLNLLRIDPATMSVVLADELRSTSYGELHGRPIRLPDHEHFHPKIEFLEERWATES